MFPFVEKADGLFFPKQIFLEFLFFPSKPSKRKPGCKNNLGSSLSFSFSDLLCQCSQRQKIIIVIGSLTSHQRLPPGSTHIKFPIVLQDILHGIRLVIVSSQSGRETYMGSFYGIISMVNSYNDKSPHPFWFFLFFSSR